jgi:ubiquitin C-terminal hydrolase
LIEDCDVVSIAASLQNQCVVAASAKKPAVVVLPRMADKRKTDSDSMPIVETQSYKPPGIVNTGVICYVNSAVQVVVFYLIFLFDMIG